MKKKLINWLEFKLCVSGAKNSLMQTVGHARTSSATGCISTAGLTCVKYTSERLKCLASRMRTGYHTHHLKIYMEEQVNV